MFYIQTEKNKIIKNSHLDPAFNLACEEHFFRRSEGSFVLLWRNTPAIIIGRNQNAYAEIDTRFVAENNIAVIRRLTGGGAVYHDEGNLNFTFICPGRGSADFSGFLTPVVDYLRSLGLDASFSGRNDIIVDGYKVSGCAKASGGGRQMVHGTLLFNADMSVLSRALKPNPLKLQSKGVASVRSRVANISDLLGGRMSVEEFEQGLYARLSHMGSCLPVALTAEDEAEINALKASKYALDEWNMGAAPAFTLEKTARVGQSLVTAGFDVRAGRLANVRLYGDFFGDMDIAQLEALLCGVAAQRGKIVAALEGVDLYGFIGSNDAEALETLFVL